MRVKPRSSPPHTRRPMPRHPNPHRKNTCTTEPACRRRLRREAGEPMKPIRCAIATSAVLLVRASRRRPTPTTRPPRRHSSTRERKRSPRTTTPRRVRSSRRACASSPPSAPSSTSPRPLATSAQGKLASAWSKFLEVASKARAAGQNRTRAGGEGRPRRGPRASIVEPRHRGPCGRQDARARREAFDGTSVGTAEWGTSIPADSGPHLVEATAPGRQPWSTTAHVDDGAKTTTITTCPISQPLPSKPMERARTT